MNSPLFPKGGTSTEARRLQEAAQELATKVIDSGQFVQRGKVERLIRPQPTGIPSPVAFGALNRILTTSDAAIQLPRIEPKWIGVPLQVAKLTTDGLMYVLPSGRLRDGSRAPYVDGVPYRACSTPGLYTFVTDGSDWFSHGAETYRLFDVRLFGASPAASGAVNTAAFQAAFDAASAVWLRTGAVQEVYVPPGLYRMLVGATKSWDMPLGGHTEEVHVAVHVRSGVRLVANGATFAPVPPASASTDWYYAIFGVAALNMTVGDLERFSIEGGNFDYSDAHWTATLTLIYGVLIVGGSDIEIDGATCLNTGSARIGRFARVMNSENVRITNWRADFVQQGLYLIYVNGLTITGTMTRFSEAIDIDSVCQNVWCHLVAKNSAGGDEQCLDISSVINGYFVLECESVGNGAVIYQKPEAYATFALWCANVVTSTPATAPVFCENVVLEIQGNDIHSASFRSVQVSLNREDPPTPNYWDGKGIMKRITVRALLKDCDPILVYECDGLDLTADMEDVTCGTVSRQSNAAVILRQSRTDAIPIAESKLSGRAILRVKDSERIGVLVIGPTDFHLEATVDGYNTVGATGSGAETGVFIEGLGLKDGVCTIANIRCSNGDTAGTPVDLRFAWGGSGGTIRIRDLGGHRLASGHAFPVSAGLTSGYFLNSSGEKPFGYNTYTLSGVASGVAAQYGEVLGMVRTPGAVMVSAEVVNQTQITGVATGAPYTTLSMRRVRGGVTSSAIGDAVKYDNIARAAGSVTSLGIQGVDSDGVFVDGDLVAIQFTGATGLGGSVCSGLWARWNMVEYY